MPRNYEQKESTTAIQFYNSSFGTLILGFLDNSAFVKVANVFPQFKGERTKPKTQMYDYTNSIMMTLNGEELSLLSEAMGDLLSNKIPLIEFSHYSRDFISKFQIGVGLDGESKDLQIVLTKVERNYPDADPVAEVWYSFNSSFLDTSDEKKKKFIPEVTLFKFWIMESIRLTLGLLVHSNQLESRAYKGSFGDSEPSRRNNRSSSRRDDDDDDEDRSVRKRKVVKRNDDDDDEAPKSSKRKSKRNEATEDYEEDEDDNIPF